MNDFRCPGKEVKRGNDARCPGKEVKGGMMLGVRGRR